MEMVKKDKKKEHKKKRDDNILMTKKKSIHEVSEKRIKEYGKKKK